MNEQFGNYEIDTELQVRLMNLVMGEVSDFERDQLQVLMEQRPELTAYYEHLAHLHGLLLEVGAGDPAIEADADDTSDFWNLSTERRQKILAVLDTSATGQPDQVTLANKSTPKRWRIPVLESIVVALCACVLIGLMLPTQFAARQVSRDVAFQASSDRPATTANDYDNDYLDRSTTSTTLPSLAFQIEPERAAGSGSPSVFYSEQSGESNKPSSGERRASDAKTNTWSFEPSRSNSSDFGAQVVETLLQEKVASGQSAAVLPPASLPPASKFSLQTESNREVQNEQIDALAMDFKARSERGRGAVQRSEAMGAEPAISAGRGAGGMDSGFVGQEGRGMGGMGMGGMGMGGMGMGGMGMGGMGMGDGGEGGGMGMGGMSAPSPPSVTAGDQTAVDRELARNGSAGVSDPYRFGLALAPGAVPGSAPTEGLGAEGLGAAGFGAATADGLSDKQLAHKSLAEGLPPADGKLSQPILAVNQPEPATAAMEDRFDDNAEAKSYRLAELGKSISGDAKGAASSVIDLSLPRLLLQVEEEAEESIVERYHLADDFVGDVAAGDRQDGAQWFRKQVDLFQNQSAGKEPSAESLERFQKASDPQNVEAALTLGVDLSRLSRRGQQNGQALPPTATESEISQFRLGRQLAEAPSPEIAAAGRLSVPLKGQISATPGAKDELADSRSLATKPANSNVAIDEQSAAREAFSTFSLHVSDVSFKLAQSALSQGQWPEADKIRIEEFVNALDYRDPLPGGPEKVACRVEQAIHPFLMQRNLLRVSMRTAATGRSQNTPLRLTILLDNSGSMERPDRRQAVLRAFQALTAQLTAADQITLIGFASSPRLLADKVPGNQGETLLQLIENLPSEGGTNIEAALLLAGEKAAEQQLASAQNRIVLMTDGAVNLGNANPASLAKIVTRLRDSGVAFDAAGISARDLNDEVLEALTRQGDGRYYLLDSPEAANESFAAQIAGALRPSAQNVKVQVEFNPQRVGRYKLLGFEKHRLSKQDFRNDKVDAAEMAAAEAGVAVYQFEVKPNGSGDVGSVSVRFRDLSSGQMIENRWPIPYEPNVPRLEQAASSMQLAATAALLAAKLAGGPLADSVELSQLQKLLASLPEQVAVQPRVQQLRAMIDQALALGQ